MDNVWQDIKPWSNKDASTFYLSGVMLRDRSLNHPTAPLVKQATLPRVPEYKVLYDERRVAQRVSTPRFIL
jgi:hypothetical protein